MANVYDIVIRPIITERSMASVADKKYVFEVAKDAGKIEIKNAVEQIFGVKVAKVNTINVSGRGPSRYHPQLEEGLRPADGRFQDHRNVRGHGVRRRMNNGYQDL